jgi:hypothetical protein
LQPDDPRLAVIKTTITEMSGNQATHTPDLARDFIGEGLDTLPMAAVYESDYLSARISGKITPASGITAMYPNPDILSRCTLVAWDPRGTTLLNLLTSSAMMNADLAQGYRLNPPDAEFVHYMHDKGITVPSLNTPYTGLAFRSEPSTQGLERLNSAIAPPG